MTYEPGPGLGQGHGLDAAAKHPHCYEPESALTLTKGANVTSNAKNKREDRGYIQEGIRRAAPTRKRTLNIAWFDGLTENEQMIAVAKANLEAYGSLTAPREIQLTVLEKTCPRCGRKGAALTMFGVKIVRDIAKVQTWCRDCRSETSVTQSKRTPREPAAKK